MAFAVNDLMERHFPDLVDMQFTAQMEQALDDIAEGHAEGRPYLKSFFLGDDGLDQQVKAKEQEIDPRDIHALVLDDINARVRVGRYGAYLEQENNGDTIRISLPDNLTPADLNAAEIERLLREKEQGPTPLGRDPETGQPIFVLAGPYGPYVQLGENGDTSGPKPRRVSLPKGVKPENISLDQALQLLALPRVLGAHPATGEPVEAGIGRFGPYVRHDGEYRSLNKRARTCWPSADRRSSCWPRRNAAASGPAALREIGPHPVDGEPVAIFTGRYGPYVKHGKTNASLPKNADPSTLTMEHAVELLAARKEKKGRKKRKTGNTAE